jgi:hypothetical protein
MTDRNELNDDELDSVAGGVGAAAAAPMPSSSSADKETQTDSVPDFGTPSASASVPMGGGSEE